MNVLITNDDGIQAPGIRALARAFHQARCEVWIVAPDRERSATGHAITMHHPLRADEVELPELCHSALAVDGTPADCVKLAVECIMPRRPDLVISGINRGSNLGTDVLYSGTVSAALEGLILGLPAIAVSLAGWESLDYGAAAKFAHDLALVTLSRGLPPDTMLNVNVPIVPAPEIAGVRVTRLGQRRYRNFFEPRQDPRGRRYFWLSGELMDCPNDADTDVGAVDLGYVSVTPIHFDLTHEDMIGTLKEWNLSFRP
ncbi:MAG: 5'/3'-nucleotidase SurE [Bacillota bacterium]